jgi:hypothetical protein
MFTDTTNSIAAKFRSNRLLAIAIAAGALVASAPAYGEDNGPTDPSVRCAAKVGPGQYEFYLPGEKATDVNGNKWVCGPDGQWFRDYAALTLGRQSVTRVATTAVLAS